MKYRVISTADTPVHLPFSRGLIVLKKRGDGAEVDVRAVAAEGIAKHGMVRFERIVEPPKPAEKPAPKARPGIQLPEPGSPQFPDGLPKSE